MLSASAIRSAPEARAAVRWGRRAGQSRATGNAGSPAVGEPRSSGGEGICEGWFKGSFYFLF